MKNSYLKVLLLLFFFISENNQINAQNWTNYYPSDGIIDSGIYAIVEDHNNDLWFGSWTNPPGTSGLAKFNGTSWEQFNTENGLVGNNIRVLFHDSNNNLWIGTTTGVTKYDYSFLTNYTTTEGLADDYVLAIIEDTFGNIWIGTNNGVSKFDGTTWTNYTIENNFALNQISSIIQDNNGDLWFASLQSGAVKFDGTTWTNYTEADGLASNNVYVIYQDTNNDYWFANYADAGLSKFNGTTWETFTTADGLLDNSIRAIYQDNFGDLWFGSNSGALKFDGSELTAYTTTDGLIPGGVRSFYQDSNDNMWIGTWSSGISNFEISKVNIPDPYFEQSLIDLNIDSDDTLNGQILRTDAIAVTDLNLTNPLFQNDGFENPLITSVTEKISDLTGIRAFVNLTSLQLGNGALTSVDVSKNIKLDNLFFNDNQLSSIDVSKNIMLRRFGVMRNPNISSINVSKNGLLEELFVHETVISSLDVSSNLNLWRLQAQSTNLTGLNLSANENLIRLRAQNNPNLAYLNVRNGNNNQVIFFNVNNTPLLSCITADDSVSTTMTTYSEDPFSTDCGTVYIPDTNFEQALIDLGVDAAGIQDHVILRSEAEAMTGQLDVSNNGINDLTGIEAFTNLIRLKAWNNALTNVDVTQNVLLERLELVGNHITEIDVSNNTELTVLWLENNQLSTVDVSQNTKLGNLAVGINPLVSLDVTTNINLWALTTEVTQISEIDLSENINLQQLWIADNPNLTQIDLSKNPLLFNLGIYNTSIETLDLSNNNIIRLYAWDNPNLTHLDMRNGNNLNVTDFHFDNTPNLICINSDGIGIPDISQVMIDSGKTFSEDCGDFVYIPDPNFEQALIDLEIDSDGVVNQSILRSDAENAIEVNVTFPIYNGAPNNAADPRVTITTEINDLTGIEAFTNLSVLYCQYNQLQELNITNNTVLTVLECEGNQLTELDVTQNPLLRVLGFGPNSLTEIDVSQNLLLEVIWTNGNNLSTINLDANIKLAVYGLSDNPYTYVSLKNGNNANVDYFEAFNTPALDCINSDAVVSDAMSGSDKTFSEDCSTSIAGRWIIAPEYGALKVGPEPGSDLWWALNKFGDDISARSCYLDDVYEFGADGSFKNILGNETWLEPFQGVPNEQCGIPVAPHDGSVNAAYVYNQLSGSITLNGIGAYLGLPKVINGGILSDPNAAPGSITYEVSFSENGHTMVLNIESSPGVFWTFKFIKEAVFIPDTNFEQALIDLGVDAAGIQDHVILRSEAEAMTGQLDVSNNGINDLTGIEAFTNLIRLKAWNNALINVDVTQNTLLERLEIVGNQLTDIDVTQNTELTVLWLENNQLSTVDVSQNTKLYNLALGINPLISIDVTTNVDLWALTTEVTQISEIDLSENINLQQLWIADNPNLTQIDLSKNPLLFNLGIYNTSITTLDVSNNSLTRLWANDNPNLKSLDLRNGKNIDLTDFIIYNTPNLNCINADGIGIPDISQVMVDSGKTFSEDCGDFIYIHDPNFEQTLIDLGIDSDGVVNTSILKDDTVLVESLNLTNPLFQSDGFENPLITTVTEKISDLTGIEAFVDLTNLQLGNGDLTSVDLSNNSNLEELFLNDNQLTTIDITSNTQLKRFGVMRNPIVDTTVDVSQNSLLEELFLHNTGIQNIDLSNNLNLSTLFIQNNNLTTLDVELNSQLFEIRCQNNQLSQLDITTLQMIDRVDANNNPEFTLITDPIVGNSTLRSLNLSATGQDNFNGAFYPNLQWLLLNNNNLTKFNGNNNAVVEYLFLDNNFIDKLVFSANNTMLKRLDANNNVLSELDLRNGNNIELTTLNVTGNLLTCISVDDPTDATQPYPSWNFDAGVILSLDCKGEPEIVLIPDANFEQALIDGGIDQDGIGHNGSILLSDALATVELDVYLRGIVDMTGIEAFENLEILDASFNNFDDIDLTNCTKLTQVNLTSNNLTSLMLTSTKDLTQLYVGINNLTSLNLEELKNLTNVDLDFNNFTNIDASNLDKLVQFVVANNALQTLNMQNGNNQQVINFSSAGNPDLFCIAVDDANNIPSDWIKDPWSNYSNNVDCISPTIVAQDVTVYLDNKGEATVNAEDFDNGSADNITLAENLLFSVNILDFDCSNLNITNNVELTVTDEAGNFSKAPVNLFVLDDILPTVSAKPTFTADLNGMSVYELNPLDILKSSQDNCSVVDYTVNPTTFTTLGIYEVTLTAIDGSGNTAQDTSEVEIIDSLASKDLKFGGTTAVIFPVPFGNELSMTFSKVVNLSSVSGQLTDMLGNSFPLVFSPSNGNGTFVSADTSFLLSGSYILQVSLGNKSDSEVVVKE